MMKSEILNTEIKREEIYNNINIETVLLEENYYNNKDLYLKTKNNVILLNFFYKLIFYIATGILILVDLYIIAYFLTDESNEFLKQEYSYDIKANMVISIILYILSSIFYVLYKRNKNLLIKFSDF